MAISVKPKTKSKAKTEAIEPQHADKKQGNTKKEPSFLPWRFAIVGIAITVMAVALILKNVELQLVDADIYIKKANDYSLSVKELPFTRGRILDRNGNILATSVPVNELSVSPRDYFDYKLKRNDKRWLQLAIEMGASRSKIVESVDKFIERKNKSKERVEFEPRDILNTRSEGYWRLLARVTGLDYDELVEKVRNNPQSQFVQSDREDETYERMKWERIAEVTKVKYNDLMSDLYKAERKNYLSIAHNLTDNLIDHIKSLKIVGLHYKGESKRVYPNPYSISLAQLIGYTDKENKKGIEGLERHFNQLLIGEKGKQSSRKDRKGNVVENISTKYQYNPQDIYLSIDLEIQVEAYKFLDKALKENKAKSGSAVMVDIQTGEILAMVNAPSFNPNDRKNLDQDLIRNRAILDVFEPASTVKPFVVLSALQNKVTYLDEVINTRPFVVNGHTIKDVSTHDSLTLKGILQKSSNVGVSRLALRMPSTALIDTYSHIGFGKDTGLGLGEAIGKDGNRKRWSDIDRAAVSYGYSLEVTPLQLARAYATLGSFGFYRPLSITKVDPPIIGDRVLPEKISKEVVHLMESVAQKGEGGAKAMVENYRVAVKTGTARKVNEKGQYIEKYLAYTAGIAPASDPRFALVVLINEPSGGQYYGGSVSAPVFSEIMGFTLKAKNIQPDNLPKATKTDNKSRTNKPKQH